MCAQGHGGVNTHRTHKQTQTRSLSTFSSSSSFSSLPLPRPPRPPLPLAVCRVHSAKKRTCFSTASGTPRSEYAAWRCSTLGAAVSLPQALQSVALPQNRWLRWPWWSWEGVQSKGEMAVVVPCLTSTQHANSAPTLVSSLFPPPLFFSSYFADRTKDC